MSITQISVLALDAVDYRLAQDFDCDNILLDRSGELETEEWSAEYPSTKEVWPSVATGVTPDVHGLELFDKEGRKDIDVEFSNPLIKIARKFKGVVPVRLRKPVSRRIRSNSDVKLEQTDHPHFFDNVYMWPGITSATHLNRSHTLLNRVLDEELHEDELGNQVLDFTLDEFKWHTRADGDIIGVHSHILDVAGHIHALERSELEEYYRRVDTLVGWLRQDCDELVILSDHGMQVGWLDDPDPGQHSYRAMVSTTEGMDGLPESIYDVRSWIESHKIINGQSDRTATLDSTEEQLEDLGYL